MNTRRRIGRGKTQAPVFCGALLLCLPACNLLLPAAFVGEHRTKVLAEFDKLPNSRVAVVVWAPASTRFDYPQIGFELGAHITELLGTNLTTKETTIDLVDPRDVADFLQKEPSAANNPMKVGEEFKTDYVVFVEIHRFQVRDPDAPELLRPAIDGGVSVYDVRAPSDERPRYELAPVEVEYNDGKPVLLTATNSYAVRDMIYRMFAEQAARKFYEHSIEM
ncbi:MAG: hypothetical protein FLDDKLPJ_03112 [Phycisphaerae bacterium]|nr:hypothetical protein [Phycisphaerae bacterium]